MNPFATDVDKGLSAPLKNLSSKYFYDDRGSLLFRQIMEMPEYYLTDCEFEILKTQAADIVKQLGFSKQFNIIELGAGDGAKTYNVLSYLDQAEVPFTYMPIDISEEALVELKKKMLIRIPELSIHAVTGDYFEVLEEVAEADQNPNLFLFLGSNIGNYRKPEAIALLELFQQTMQPNDKLLLGVDLQKNPNTIKLAYDDPHGITRAFNMNLLSRINAELGANFRLDQFDFFCHYNPISGEVRSYLVSLKDQRVEIPACGQSYLFEKNELLFTELSKKYTLGGIEQLAALAGFKTLHHYLDKKQYFSDSLLVK